MSQALKITVSEKTGGFLFKEVTGTYSTSNKDGYGGNNKDIDEVVAATITIAGGNLNVEIDATDYGFPSKTGTEKLFTAEILGVSKIESGVYTVTYKVVFDDETELEVTVTVLMVYEISCCVEGKVIAEDYSDLKAELPQSVKNKALLETAIEAYDCGYEAKANKIVQGLNQLCC